MKVKPDRKRLCFVVQKHKATALHYDFRLQIGEVMASWSIPKGPTLDCRVKRLALSTPDHPLEYRHFEGVIPAGRYGAGPVMVWDEGTYAPELEKGKGVKREVTVRKEAEEIMRRNLKEGNLKFQLYGKKLKGSFALVRTTGIKGKEAWLLIKHRDEHCKEGYDAAAYDFSAASGLSLARIVVQNGPGSTSFGQQQLT